MTFCFGMPPAKHFIFYYAQVPAPQPYISGQPSDYPGPHDFLILSVITLIICGILNVTSLLFGVPAMVLALKVYQISFLHGDAHDYVFISA